jgi:predicted transcriptional regulator
MASKRRNQISIVSDILNTCVEGATKAKIVHQANLNFSTVYPYLINLINKGLIEEIAENSKVLYKTTLKGLEFKRKIEQTRTVMDEINSCV